MAREVNLYYWVLVDKAEHGQVGKHFVIDRGDSKRKSTNELKSILFELEEIHDLRERKRLTISAFKSFRGVALSYNCRG